ncbi:MAG: GNAT family N-acetyltransferase [Candidatus Thorarchaeota archaeon]|nr:MAG: GNAT family N-acetyltransferase [Candidatus Thorarchaeota archaeon]
MLSEDDLDIVAGICLDPSVPAKWREIMKPAMEARRDWLKAMMQKGLQVTAVLGPKGEKKGLIEHVPIQLASEPVSGTKSLFINCIWVVEAFWRTGAAKPLIEHCIKRAEEFGGVSVLAYDSDRWFGFMPYMPSSFFEKFGFVAVDRDESRVLLHLDLGGGEKPTLIPPKTRILDRNDRPIVEVLFNNQCPWSGWMADKVRRAMKKYKAIVEAVNTDDRSVVEEYGLSRGVCVNGVPVMKRMATVKEIEAAVKTALE